MSLTDKERANRGRNVTIIGSVLNLLLSAGKLLAGYFAKSHAMIADGVHSLSDLGTDLAVIVGLKMASKPKDECHNYGHGKAEILAALVISGSLLAVGIGIAKSGIEKIIGFFNGQTLETPGILALIIAISSVILKELLFRYTLRNAKKLESPSMEANAHHHRSDAFSSLGTAAGIAGAIFLGSKWAVLDPAAAIIVAILIIVEAIKLGKESLDQLMEKSLSTDERDKMLSIAEKVNGVVEPHNLRTRKVGTIYIIEMHIRVDENLSVKDAHGISHKVEQILQNEYKSAIITIHIEPAKLTTQ